MTDRNHPRRPARTQREYGWPLDEAGDYIHVPGWTNPAEAAQQNAAYRATLVRRLQDGLPLTNTDRREALRYAKGAV